MNEEKDSKSFICKNPNSTDFPGIDFTDFPTNCAMGLINSEKKPSTL